MHVFWPDQTFEAIFRLLSIFSVAWRKPRRAGRPRLLAGAAYMHDMGVNDSWGRPTFPGCFLTKMVVPPESLPPKGIKR